MDTNYQMFYVWKPNLQSMTLFTPGSEIKEVFGQKFKIRGQKEHKIKVTMWKWQVLILD